MTAREALSLFLERFARYDDPAVVTTPISATILERWAADIDRRPAAEVPLRGTTFVVKDNIDVVGVPTTIGCPSCSTIPRQSATVVGRLMNAGGLPVAKVNLDQFATGLVGTRSPYGTPRNPFDPTLVPGGSSSGSAVAVATGLSTFALGTDTAGSGRVPAAMCGIVGIKPTRGWLSCVGVVPAVRSIDCVAVFADSVGLGATVTEIAAAHDMGDPFSRRPPVVSSPPIRRFGVLSRATLVDLDVEPLIIAEYNDSCEFVERLGFEVCEIDPTDLFAVGDQLYGGPWVTERLAAVGHLLRSTHHDLDPTVSGIMRAGEAYSAVDVHRARYAVEALLHRIRGLFDAVDALLFPTIGWHVTLDDVARDPLGPNARLGRFTTFTNLADLCALTIPIGSDSDRSDRILPPTSVTIHGPAWSDRALVEAARLIVGGTSSPSTPSGWLRLAVAGAHLRGEALEHQLIDRGAVFVSTTTTAPVYRMYAIANSAPAKPALVHVGPGGAAIEVDIWAIPPDGFGRFVDAVPPPLCIGTVELEGGVAVAGFVSEPRALDGATEITRFGGWRNYRRSGEG